MSYLRTLRRIPADIVRAMATRPINPTSPVECLCGWALREQRGREVGCDAGDLPIGTQSMMGTPESCSQVFGGSIAEWERVFIDIVHEHHAPKVELAFVRRVAEACGRP